MFTSGFWNRSVLFESALVGPRGRAVRGSMARALAHATLAVEKPLFDPTVGPDYANNARFSSFCLPMLDGPI